MTTTVEAPTAFSAGPGWSRQSVALFVVLALGGWEIHPPLGNEARSESAIQASTLRIKTLSDYRAGQGTRESLLPLRANDENESVISPGTSPQEQ